MSKKLSYMIILVWVFLLFVSLPVSSSGIKEKTLISGNYSTIMINKELEENQKWEYEIKDNNILKIVSESYTKQLETDDDNVIKDIHTWYLKALATGSTQIEFYVVDSTGKKTCEETMKYNIKVIPETIEVRPGNLVKIELRENRSTGFTWHLEIEDNNIAKVHHDNYIEPDTESEKAGQSGIHYWYIKGVNQGETKLTFKYYRDWEKENVAEAREYIIKVRNNKKI